MPGRAAPPNRPRAGITAYERNMRSDLLMIYPALSDDIAVQNPPRLRQNGVAFVNRGAAHVIPGPGLNNQAAAPNLPLQIDEQADVEAMRAVLQHLLPDNLITPQHFHMALTQLSAILPTHGPYRIPELQREYARILRRMARVMTPPTHDQYYDETMAVLGQELAVDCPLELRECLEKLLEAMSVAFSLTRGHGGDGGVVFVAVEDCEAFASALASLASRLERPFS